MEYARRITNVLHLAYSYQTTPYDSSCILELYYRFKFLIYLLIDPLLLDLNITYTLKLIKNYSFISPFETTFSCISFNTSAAGVSLRTAASSIGTIVSTTSLYFNSAGGATEN